MIKLVGHSNCSVVLLDNKTVRKTSPSQNYDIRLESQMKKQMNFHSSVLLAPKVTNFGKNADGRFFYDMEYIRGRSLCQVYRNESSFYCQKLIDRILTIHRCSDSNPNQNILPLIVEKIKSLGGDRDLDVISSCDWNVSLGYCHGDLTFENVIVSDDGVYLIDFLDSFVDSPIVDEAKLLQDAYCYWSFLKEGYVPERKLAPIVDMFDTKRHYCMLLIHLMRILPYASPTKRNDVLCMIKSVRAKINRF